MKSIVVSEVYGCDFCILHKACKANPKKSNTRVAQQVYFALVQNKLAVTGPATSAKGGSK